MKKITLLFITTLSLIGFSQSKSTGTIALSNSIPITANFTLNNNTSQVTLVLTGPFDRWFGLGFGTEVVQGFGMNVNSGQGDVVVFTTNTIPNLTDRNYIGTQQPAQDTAQDWTTVSNTISGSVRTLTLTRSLTTTDTTKDFQLPYLSTNSINFAGVRSLTATMNVGGHGGASNAGYASNIPFTTLGVEDFSLRASSIYPNPSNGEFLVKTKTFLKQINIYSQTGVFVKTIEIDNTTDEVEVNVKGLQTGVYLIELVNDSEKSWKKVIIQ